MKERLFKFPICLLAALLLGSSAAFAQSVLWTTNFYQVTGNDFREIRASIVAARPWSTSFDAHTSWKVNWKFSVQEGPTGCIPSAVTTITTITTTMPRWTPPTNVPPHVKEQWTLFYVALAHHEAGHARIAVAAAEEIRARTRGVPLSRNCEEVRRSINERAEKVIDDFRRRELDYDRDTDHGRKPGTPRLSR